MGSALTSNKHKSGPVSFLTGPLYITSERKEMKKKMEYKALGEDKTAATSRL